MRERLAEIYHKIEVEFLDYMINLTQRAIDGDIEDKIQKRQGFYVDKLLEYGIIVPPCKVGTVVYVVRSQTSNGKNLYLREELIDHYRVFDKMAFMVFESGRTSVPDYLWKTTVFLTREEAEAALKGGVQE